LNSLGYDIRRTERKFSSGSHELILPKVAVADIVNGSVPVKMMEPVVANGNVSILELLVLNTLVARLSPRMLFEIGTFDGRTTLNITANAGPGAKTFTLDLPREELANTAYALNDDDIPYADKQISGERFLNTPWHEQIEQLYGDSAKFDFQPYHGKAGFVFIDGCHAYEYVKSDSEVALRLAATPAIIVWHDYAPWWSGSVKSLEELYRSGGVFAGLRHIEETSLAILPLGISL
jgi:predicted O-methyltransferase YrrM